MKVKKKQKISEQVKESANRKIEKPKIDTSVLIQSGSTLLNLACTDCPEGAFIPGRIITLPGGSASGKTMLMLTMLAECSFDKNFDEYNFVYDDGEETYDGFDVKHLFGEKLFKRIQPPATFNNGRPLYSETIQDFKANILTKTREGVPFIYILDSLDSLTGKEELEREYKQALLKAKDPEIIKDIKGSFKTEKAKAVGETLRMVNNKIKYTKSVLFIVQQERANIGVMIGSKKTTSGGKAPLYYSTHQVWMNKKAKIFKDIRGQKIEIGNKVIAKVTKNKITGKLRTIEFDIYPDYGIDDISSCIDFLVSTRYWKKNGKKIQAIDFDIQETKSILIEQIENKELHRKLQKITGKIWNEIEDIAKPNRQQKYQ